MRLGPSVVSGPKADHTADRCWSFVWLVVAYWLWPGFTGWESQWIWAHQSMDDNLRLSVFLQLVVPFKVPRCAQTLHWDQNNDIPQSPRNKDCFRLQGCFLCWDDRQARATQLSRKSETWFTTSDDFGSSYSGSHKKFSDLVPVCPPWLSCQKTWLFYLQGELCSKNWRCDMATHSLWRANPRPGPVGHITSRTPRLVHRPKKLTVKRGMWPGLLWKEVARVNF